MKLVKIILLVFFLLSFLVVSLRADELKAMDAPSTSEFKAKTLKEPIIAKGLTEKECYNYMLKACEKQKWDQAIGYGDCLQEYRFRTSSGKEALYFLGVAYFEKKVLDKANEYFTQYLTQSFMPRFFEETMTYKFKIAEQYRQGRGKTLFGAEKMPAWIPAEEDALKLYDEVINAMPQSPLAMQALFNKARLHFKFEEYKEAIDALENFIGKYPKHELTIQSYLLISQSYLKQADPKHHENDLLNLAQLNLDRFEKSFPLEEKTAQVKADIRAMEEIYAQGLFEVARFYQKKKAQDAVNIYYRKIKTDFPHTKTAKTIRLLEQKQLKSVSNEKAAI